MSEQSPGHWPTMPGGVPARAPIEDPLQPANPTRLAPTPLPSRVGEESPTDETPTAEVTRRTPELPAALPGQSTLCPSCGSEVATYESFCEVCGGELSPTTSPPAAAPSEVSTVETTRPTKLTEPQSPPDDRTVPRECQHCGGLVGPDRYCTRCGARAVSERDHFSESPSSWVGGVSDVGLRHEHNEDAMALFAETEPTRRAILIVCDGITTSHRSDVASLAAARAARTTLSQALAEPAHSIEDALQAAAEAAQNAVIEASEPTIPNPGSCTFAVAVVDGSTVHHGGIGDARVYWISEQEGSSDQLTVDDSMAQVRMDMGMSREEAEHSIAAHAVTRWLGRDAVDLSPHAHTRKVAGPGWVVVCSDGLWNYASEAEHLAGLVREMARSRPEPTELAQELVAWACSQGGRDNITVALARIEGVSDD